MKPIIGIYTDGSCCGNPGPAGWGFLMFNILDPEGPKYEKYGATHDENNQVVPCTNQQSEMMALDKALVTMINRYKQDKPDPSEIIIYSDSAYLLNCFIKKWYVNWIKYQTPEGVWLTSKKEPVCNQWLWTIILEKLNFLEKRGIKLTYSKVKGHSGNPLNERADVLANMGTQMAKDILLPSTISENV